MTFPGSLQFFQNQISWLFQVSHTTFSDLHRHTHQYWKHAITEHQHKLSWHADFTISDDFVLWFFTLLSSTYFTCCLKYSFNYWHIFYPPMWVENVGTFPHFPNNSAFSLTFPNTYSFPWSTGILICWTFDAKNQDYFSTSSGLNHIHSKTRQNDTTGCSSLQLYNLLTEIVAWH